MENKMKPLRYYFYLRLECNYKPVTAALCTIQVYCDKEEYARRGQKILDYLSRR